MNALRWCGLVGVLLMVNVSAAEAQCTYSVSPTTISVGSIATNRTLSIITGTQCSWTAVSGASWMTVTAGASGSGIGSVTFTIAANPDATPRTGTLTVAGQTVTVTQGVGTCSYSVSPTSISVDNLATSRTLSIISGTQCPWTATTTATWITIVSGASGSGIAPVTFNIAANPGAARTGTLTVAGQTVTVNQGGNPSAPTGPSAPKNVRIVGQ